MQISAAHIASTSEQIEQQASNELGHIEKWDNVIIQFHVQQGRIGRVVVVTADTMGWQEIETSQVVEP